jgi:hypothetical protein
MPDASIARMKKIVSRLKRAGTDSENAMSRLAYLFANASLETEVSMRWHGPGLKSEYNEWPHEIPGLGISQAHQIKKLLRIGCGYISRIGREGERDKSGSGNAHVRIYHHVRVGACWGRA